MADATVLSPADEEARAKATPHLHVPRLVLSADAQVTHGKVVELLDLARQAGVTQIALGVTTP